MTAINVLFSNKLILPLSSLSLSFCFKSLKPNFRHSKQFPNLNRSYLLGRLNGFAYFHCLAKVLVFNPRNNQNGPPPALDNYATLFASSSDGPAFGEQYSSNQWWSD